MLQTKDKMDVFACIGDEISAEKNLQKKNRSLKILDAFIFLTQNISDV